MALIQIFDPVICCSSGASGTEADNFRADLHQKGIEPWAWLINSRLMLGHSTSPLLQQPLERPGTQSH